MDTTEVSDQEIFNESVAAEPVTITDAPPTEEAAPVETVAEKAERERDEKGRFVAKEAAPEPEQPAAVEDNEKPEHRIPSWRLREEAERARGAEQRAQQLEQMLAQYEQRLKALEPKPEPQKFPDIFAEPEALPQYLNQVLSQEREKMQSEFKAAIANMSLQRAHDKYGDTFMEAYQDVISRPVDDPVRQQVINSPDPGTTLVQLYQREQTIKEVGTDPTAYRNKVLEEALKDKDFLAKALDAARGVASSQPTQTIKLPPSINKATAAANMDGDTDTGDRGMYRHAIAR